MSAPRTYLTTTLDEAKKQLESRERDGEHRKYGTAPTPERMQWHTQNIDILRWMFTTGEISESYRRIVEKTFKDGGLTDTTMNIAISQLRNIIVSLPVFVPPKEPLVSMPTGLSQGIQADPTSKSAPTLSSVKWEFHSCLVADPSSAVDASKSMNLNEVLVRLSREGWELISAVPARQGEAHGKIYSEYYRLFLKRPIR